MRHQRESPAARRRARHLRHLRHLQDGSVPDVKDLLPLLAGAASAFVARFLIQVYVVPLTETRATSGTVS